MKRSFVAAVCGAALAALSASGFGAETVYSNNFNGPLGSAYPEWKSSPIKYASALNPAMSGVLPAPPVTNCASPNKAAMFLGEFGGPMIGKNGDPDFNHVRVDQTISLVLTNLPPHQTLKLSFNLLVLKSWDGNSPAYGPDIMRVSVANGPVLLETTFSNNPKVTTEGSYQNYPKPGSMPRTGAFTTNTLGYGNFFGDSTYHFEFTFEHAAKNLVLDFHSSLFEGKGTADESWGLDDVTVTIGAPVR